MNEFPALPGDIRYWDDHQLLNKIIGKACARDPHKRHTSVDQMLEELESV